MIDPTATDWAGDNTSRAKRAKLSQWLLRVALFVIGFTLFTLIFWSV